jgi:hypothetical protein
VKGEVFEIGGWDRYIRGWDGDAGLLLCLGEMRDDGSKDLSVVCTFTLENMSDDRKWRFQF